MTLPDFLLARYAETEAKARDGVDTFVSENGGWRLTGTGPGRDRVLADIESKRRIVKAHYVEGNSGIHECPDEDGGEPFWSPLYEESPTPWCSTLRLLALPFADYPDFDESWRP